MADGRHGFPGPWSAWAVHAYTATGAVLAFAAASAVMDGDLRRAFLWLFTAVVVDATDGVLARYARVQERLPNFSGSKLDDIVDYLTFVFVPALIVARADLVPSGWLVPVAAAMLLSSAYGFVSPDAKTPDQFTGFPSYWNIVVLYLVLFQLAPLYNAAILLLLAALVFVRIGYIYPSRTPTWRLLTLTLGGIWTAMMLVLILRLPAAPRPIALLSLFFPTYYALLSVKLHLQR
jgi:phosphatidylcholine synthase